MNQDEFERLAESAFDDRDDVRVRERLETLAAGDPELNGRWKDLQAARAGLAGQGLEPLPVGLHETLIAAVSTAGRRPRERGSWLSFITAAIQVRPVFALGGAVAAGLAIGVIGLGLMMGGLRVGHDLAPATTASLPPIQAAAVTTLDQGGARVAFTVRRTAGETFVRLDAPETTPATVTLTWEPAALRLRGVRWESPDAPSFEPAPGRVVLQIPAAAGSELSFDEIVSGGSAIRVMLSAEGDNREAPLRMPR